VNSREKLLAGILGVALLAGVLYGAWAAVVSPLMEKKRQLRDLQNDMAERETSKSTLEFQNKRLQTVMYKRSLPANLEIAKQEYSSALRRILRESKVPIGYLFEERPPDMRNIPQMAKNKPFYTKVAYTITISKIDIGTFMTFLKKFYEMNLLHQITQINLKRDNTASLAFDKRQAEQRTDLSCTLAIEAVILDGVPPRKTLFAAPTGTGALMGGMGLHSLENQAEVARGIVPQEYVRVLATPQRNYADIVTHDVFHGFVPEPEPPPKSKEKEPEKPVPKLPDLSAFVKFKKLITTSDGHSLAGIYDVSTDGYYEIDVAMVGEKLLAKGQKFMIKSEGRVIEKLYPPANWLEINNPASSGNRKFWVYGIDGKALIVGDRESALAEAPKAPAKGAPKFGKAPAAALPPADPKAAILGGIVVIGPKVERYFRWEFGQTLKQIKEIPKAEADAIIPRIQGVKVAPMPVEEKPEVEQPVIEKAPMPKDSKPAIEPGK